MTDFKTVLKRGRLIKVILIIMGAVFFARALEIQIIRHRAFSDYADSQQKSSMLLKSKRGAIHDCRGRLLAYDMEARSYSVN